MNKLLLMLFSLFLLINLNAKIVEKNGNNKLKKLKTDNNNLYIGISEKSVDLQSAINSALSHAQSQIIQNLGVKAVINLEIEDYSSEKNNISQSSFTLNKKNSISGTYYLKLKSDQVYWELIKENDLRYYLAYVQVFFSIDNYKQEINRNFLNVIDEIDINEIKDRQFRFQKLIGIIKKTEDFDREFSHLQSLLPKDILNEYCSLKTNNNEEFSSYLQNLKLTYINKDERFPRQVFFSLSLFNEDLKNFPLYIITENAKMINTNEQGLLAFTPDYSKFIKKDFYLSFYPNTQNYANLPLEKFTLYSPFYNENIIFSLDINADFARDELYREFTNALAKKNFKVSNTISDFLIKISVNTHKLSKESNVSQSVYSASINVKLFNKFNNELVDEWSFPNKQFPNLKAYGRTNQEAKKNAILLNGINNKDELWFLLVQHIEQAVKRKRF